MNRDLDYVLNYMVKYTKDRFMQDSEPMLNSQDIELVLNHIYELEQKIDKAIEYITHEWFKREQIGISHLSFSYDELQHILDILKGEDNE